MPQYSTTITTTYSNLAENLSAVTSSSNILISDPENIIIGSSSAAGTLGYILKSQIKTNVLFDISPTETEKASISSLDSAFEGCSNLSGFGAFPENHQTSATSLFKNCSSLSKVDVDSLTYIQNASSMFQNCSSLAGIKVNDLIDVIQTDYMFAGCTSLVSIDISMFQNVTSASFMFQNDTSLTSIIVSQGFLTDLNASSGMLSGCTSLSKIVRDDPAKIDRHLYIRGNTEINGTLRVSDASEKGGAVIRGTLCVDEGEILGKLGMITNSSHSVTSDDASHATRADVAGSVVGKLTLQNGENSYVYDGTVDRTFEIATGSVAYPYSLTITSSYASHVGTQTYDGTSLVSSSIYEPNQDVNTTASPTFSTVTASLNGNATSANKVNNSLSITRALSSDTSYDGSSAKSIYSPGQLLETNSSPTFSTVNANLNGNASSASTVSQEARIGSRATLVSSTMAANDFFRIITGGASNNDGYAEISTADDATEPIYVRQYTGVFTSLTRTATLLDGGGNTSFPGTVTAASFNGNATTATTSSHLSASNFAVITCNNGSVSAPNTFFLGSITMT